MTTQTTEEYKAIVRRYFEALNALIAKGVTEPDASVLDELLAPDLAQSVKERVVPGARARWGWHRIEVTDMVVPGS